MIDIAIIGCGPAGLSAAINAKARNKEAVMFGKGISTSALYKAECVDNFIGYKGVSGQQLLTQFTEHAKQSGTTFIEAKITQILQGDGYFMINAENTFYEAKAIILATGIAKGKKIKGEDELLGKGVSYCATCDGMLYRGKTVCMVAENAEGEAEANFLSDICAKVYYIPLYDGTTNLNSTIETITGKPTAVLGSDNVTALLVGDRTIDCNGVFFEKEALPMSALVPGLKITNNTIEVNRYTETSIKGIFAAGDCTGKPYQVSKAVGEGHVAALQASSYIDSLK